MRQLTIAAIWLAHLASLALAVYSIRTGGVKVVVLLYAFMIEYVFRLATIPMLYATPGVARFVSRQPGRHQRSQPVTKGDGGPPANLGIYFLLMIVLVYFAFVLANVNADRQLDLEPSDAGRDFAWATIIALLYWFNGLITRTIVIDRARPLTVNLGFNTKEVTVLALAVITGAVIVVYRQNADLPASGWTVMGPLLGYRFLYDLFASLDAIPESD